MAQLDSLGPTSVPHSFGVGEGQSLLLQIKPQGPIRWGRGQFLRKSETYCTGTPEMSGAVSDKKLHT